MAQISNSNKLNRCLKSNPLRLRETKITQNIFGISCFSHWMKWIGKGLQKLAVFPPVFQVSITSIEDFNRGTILRNWQMKCLCLFSSVGQQLLQVSIIIINASVGELTRTIYRNWNCLLLFSSVDQQLVQARITLTLLGNCSSTIIIRYHKPSYHRRSSRSLGCHVKSY